MARMARVVISFYSHYVTRLGNRRQQTFFGDDRFVRTLESLSGRVLRQRRRGPQRRSGKK